MHYMHHIYKRMKDKITKILYENSHDDSECLKIKFENIPNVINQILNLVETSEPITKAVEPITKKVYPIMIPTEKSHLFYHDCEEKLSYKIDPYNEVKVSSCRHPQHLYLVSDEDIKVGDWNYCTFTKKIKQYLINDNPKNGLCGDCCKKIVATTDRSLSITKITCNNCRQNLQNAQNNVIGYNAQCSCLINKLPQIPESFIKLWVKSRGYIESVMLECEVHKEIEDDVVDGIWNKHIIKITEDNFVIIH